VITSIELLPVSVSAPHGILQSGGALAIDARAEETDVTKRETGPGLRRHGRDGISSRSGLRSVPSLNASGSFFNRKSYGMAQFDGKVVVVTGGSRGIGRGIAAAFAREGAQVLLAASSASNLAAAAKAIAEVGARAPESVTVAADLRELAGCEAVATAVRERCKGCDILVNSAGATRAGNFLDLSDTAWLDGFALKLFGCVRMTRLMWPMLKEAQGHVVNIVGTAARTPGVDFLIGGSVNAAMANFSKGLAQLGKRDGVARCSPRTGSTALAIPTTSRRWRCFCAPRAPATSRAPPSRSMVARRPDIIEALLVADIEDDVIAARRCALTTRKPLPETVVLLAARRW
jgi:NAD(P)-dependent dehydrogenase (short-subunit alcohol dehydrogenase family)